MISKNFSANEASGLSGVGDNLQTLSWMQLSSKGQRPKPDFFMRSLQERLYAVPLAANRTFSGASDCRDLDAPLLVIRRQPRSHGAFILSMYLWWLPWFPRRSKRDCYRLPPVHSFYFRAKCHRPNLRRQSMQVKVISTKRT